MLVMYWIPKVHKNPVSFHFPVCSIKPHSKHITSIFHLFHKWRDIIQKERHGQELRTSGLLRVAPQ